MSQSEVVDLRPEDFPAVDERAERAVLGALLLHGESRFVKGLEARGLSSESFYWAKYGAVFKAMSALAGRNESIDSITVYAELQRGEVSDVTHDDVDWLAGEVPTSRHIREYADLVVECAKWRERRRVAYEMAQAVAERNQEAWKKIAETFAVPKRSAPTTRTSFLRLVDGNTGQVVGEHRACENCQKVEDQLHGAEKENRAWRARYAELKRDKEEDARQDPQWLVAQALYKVWQHMTGHKRSPFTADRFYECKSYLARKEYGPETVERAIAGLAFDPFITTRKNGTQKKHDGWYLLFQNADKFEEYACKAPKGWKPTLRVTSTLTLDAEDGTPEADGTTNLAEAREARAHGSA